MRSAAATRGSTLATSVTLSAHLRTSLTVDPADAPGLELRAVSPAWRLMTPAIADDDAWRTVVISDRRLGPAIMLESTTAERLRLTGPAAVTVLLSATEMVGRPDRGGAATARSGTAATTAPPVTRAGGGADSGIELLDVPVFGTYTELNKVFTTGGIVNFCGVQVRSNTLSVAS